MRQKTAGGVEAAQILVDAVTQGFLILASKWTDSLGQTMVFFLFNGPLGTGLSQESGLLTPMGWISMCTLEAENVPVLACMNFAWKSRHFLQTKTSFFVYDAEGTCTQSPIETLSVRSSNSGSAVKRDSAPRRVSLTRQQVTFLKI